MRPSSSYQDLRTAPIRTGWVQTGERWALWWNARAVATVAPDGAPGVRLWMEGQKMWHTKVARAASIRQGKRFAERWCAARLYPGMPLREAVERLVNAAAHRPAQAQLSPLEQQQVRRLADAADQATARIKEALDARGQARTH
ncbi:hypothetical protein C1924_10170 [Stenotrophomonas sp. ESTM1D_MKCIP4_1]|uniref:hypothetical protein n=1 Tax=Stenotrophomonas sp. ESTM1D_MKCIP4_1 TaxID=2072414 RepID=UPI000D53E69D|nr:hypothetical protein [Stenotrophomonas sp. ESTM1D_MKCIP4_1]AWH53518.1 hypothetical protein C1924_10170 [Stenotrophomonas sp. ESTM1D_MKCIP4_1]